MKFGSCSIRKISHTNVRLHLQANLSEPINSIWIHGVVYRQFSSNVFRKFLFDMWEEACSWFSGKSVTKNFILEHAVTPLIDQWNLETNMFHACPYEGYVYVKSDNLSLNLFHSDQLLPSGRYRIDFTMARTKNGEWIAKAVGYASISDHRVEIF